MLLTDYLIDQQGKDWAGLLSDWVPPLPPSFTVWMVNLFGDVFAVYNDGSVHMLDLGTGALERVADNREHFCDLADRDDNASDWLMIPLVDACRAAGLVLSSAQCYGFKIPPLLSGKYEVDNVAPRDLAEYFASMADLVRQTKELPDGTKVEIVIKQTSYRAVLLEGFILRYAQTALDSARLFRHTVRTGPLFLLPSPKSNGNRLRSESAST